ncbi:TPA: hypothetical protein SIA26_003886 [Aeromonas bestiarum]|nr:hypothetical protein [Aeromonas bestiarum]
MAAGIPIEKAQQYVEEFNALLIEHKRLDLFTERKVRAELSATPTHATNIALCYLDAITDKVESALPYLRSCLDVNVNDANLALHYNHILINTFNYREHGSVCYSLADKYLTKRLSNIAYGWAYRYGDRDQLAHYMDTHIKLLSESEGRSDAMRHKDELLAEMDSFYNATQCSREQFQILASIIWTLLGEHKAITGLVQLSGSGCYIVDITNFEPKVIAKMNFELADRVCSEPILDNCPLLARFTSPRKLHTGVSYHAGNK